MTSLKYLADRGVARLLPSAPISNNKKFYVACLCVFGIGTLSRIFLDHYWHSVSPRTIDIVGGQTYALCGRGGTVYIKPIEGHLLEYLAVLPSVFLLLGLLVWARAWREWR